MRALVLILLFIAFPLAGGTLKPELEADFWANSGADARLAKRLVNDADCLSSAIYFRACITAIVTAAKIQKLDQQPDIRALSKARWGSRIPFERIYAQILNSKTGEDLPWLIGRSMNAGLKVFDPYAQISPKVFVESQLSGEVNTYYGTGIESAAYGAGLFVFAVVPNSPAARVGLKPNDRIVSLNGEKLNTLSLAHNAIFKLRANPNERLHLEIERDGELYHTEISAAPVVMPVDPSQVLKFGGHGYLHLRLRAFRRGVCSLVETRVREAGAIEGLVLDLRHNRGGLVEEAECLVRLFADEPRVVTRQALRLEFPPELNFEKDLPDHSKKAGARAAFSELKLIVLLDGQSASASELTAGALQDFKRAWIVGERSFGKGITQLYGKVDEYPKLELLKTVSRYLRPSGIGVHGQGIRPNFEIPFRAGAGPDARRVIREEDSGSYFRLPSEPWSETRGGMVQTIRACMVAGDRARTAESSLKEQLGYADHQLAGALSVFGCL